jgi:hypothetical protein
MQSTGRLTVTPVCAANRAPYSAKVASLSAATNWRSTSHSAGPKRGAGPRPSGLAMRRPSCSAARTQGLRMKYAGEDLLHVSVIPCGH